MKRKRTIENKDKKRRKGRRENKNLKKDDEKMEKERNILR